MKGLSKDDTTIQRKGAEAPRESVDLKASRPRTFALEVLFFAVLVAGLPACRPKTVAPKADPLAGAYDTEPDWNDPQKVIPLNYQQSQGKRLFYAYCVWCHADATPAGPSNRGNVTPPPALMNDGATLNGLSDDYMETMITLGGAAVGKSAMMPPWGRTLSPDEIRAIMAFTRVIAQPPYQAPARPRPKYSVK